jgi:hypothetical protein
MGLLRLHAPHIPIRHVVDGGMFPSECEESLQLFPAVFCFVCNSVPYANEFFYVQALCAPLELRESGLNGLNKYVYFLPRRPHSAATQVNSGKVNTNSVRPADHS